MTKQLTSDVQPQLLYVADLVREYRERANLTQAALADRACVDRNTITNIECGMKDYMFTSLFKVSNYLKIPPDLIFSSPMPKSQKQAIGDLLVEVCNIPKTDIESLIFESISAIDV